MIAARPHTRVEHGRRLPMLVSAFAEPLLVASTASIGGGLGERRWVINAQVPHDFARRDLDRYGAQLAGAAGLGGAGVVMLTAADVHRVRRAEHGGVVVAATVGLTDPIWAAEGADSAATPDAAGRAARPATAPGTINVLAAVPVRLADAALLNALCTVTEAKAQALHAARVPGTGTPSDAVTVVCPLVGPPEPFAGPRSTWGAPLARAVYDAVRAGASDPAAR